MTDTMLFLPDGRVWGFVAPMQNAETKEIDLFLCQNLEPMAIEEFDGLDADGMNELIDEVVAVFRSQQGAMNYMTLMHDAVIQGVHESVLTTMCAAYLDLCGGMLLERGGIRAV